jgi:hypothetical protein
MNTRPYHIPIPKRYHDGNMWRDLAFAWAPFSAKDSKYSSTYKACIRNAHDSDRMDEKLSRIRASQHPVAGEKATSPK